MTHNNLKVLIIMCTRNLLFAAAIAAAPAFSPAAAQASDEEPPIALPSLVLEPFSVIGNPEQAEQLPGSAHYIGAEDLEAFEHADVLRVLRQVPGVYIQEEDGLGLRPNIGIRGSGSNRSSRITLMEDGVLAAPAPYAASSAYYFPTMRRMNAVEVLKGPAAISEGPRTTGGALNLVSTPIPESAAGSASVLFGEDDTVDAHAWLGGSTENAGWLVETVQQDSSGFKTLPGGADTGTRLEDYLVKLRVNSDRGADWYQSLELKVGRTEQDGNETYLGLTDEDFERTPFARYPGSQLDNIVTEHDQQQLTYRLEPARHDWRLDATVYNNEFARNWFKLGSVNGVGISSLLDDPEAFADEMAWVRGADSPDDAFNLRNNNREYYSRGVQGNLYFNVDAGDWRHELRVGMRYHGDQEDRFQDEDLFRMEDGTLVRTTDGAPGSQANRVAEADAFALYLQDRITWDRWTFTPGLRFEDIELTREDFSTDDPDRSEGPTRVRRNDEQVVMPGLGVTYELARNWRLLAGAHKGFNPPAPGSDAEAEESINYELGARYRNNGLRAEAIGFHNDYDNLVGTCTASTGGGCVIGDEFDGGEADVTGLELLAAYDWAFDSVHVPVELAWTWTGEAEFNNSFESDFGQWGDVLAGDELPYIPEHQYQLRTALVTDAWELALTVAYVDEMRTVAGQGSIPFEQSTESFTVADLAGTWRVHEQADLFFRVDNLLDETYVAARDPAGARPGKPRTVLGGIRLHF